MGCKSCKEKNNGLTAKDLLPDTSDDKKTILTRITEYSVKFILFLILFTLLAPFIIPILAVALYYTVVMSKAVDIMPLLKFLTKKMFKKAFDNQKEEEEEDDEDEYDDDLTPYEYELENPHDIVEIK
jgi:hypothetical protein